MSDDDTYEIPLQDQRIFGAGIKRQRVKFVPSSSASSSKSAPPSSTSTNVSDLYLRLVLPGDAASKKEDTSSYVTPAETATQEPIVPIADETVSQICEICSLPLPSNECDITLPSDNSTLQTSSRKPRPHEASLAHQVCLTHSHPPSHLDRSRKGLAYLSAYGWDPDARLGLGASGQGIQYPIKTKPKEDKLGIGVMLPKDIERMKKVKPVKLDAGKIRKLHEQDRKKGEKLREMFYRNEDLERYLGGG